MSVLVLTETCDLAGDLIVLELRRRNASYWRLNTDTFPDNLEIAYDFSTSSITFRTDAAQFTSDDANVAWCRHLPRIMHPDPYVEKEARAFLSGLWREMPWTWVNSPSAVASANNKLWQLRRASEIGFDIPATVITNRIQCVLDTFGSGPVVVKTIGGAGVVRDGTYQLLYSQLISLTPMDSAAVKAAPCIFQESVKPGTDVRVTVVGDQIFATDIDSPGEFTDWRAAPPEAVRYRATDLPSQVAQNCLKLCRAAGIFYAAFDFIRQPGGRYVFLEVNPSGQWGWIEHATGQPITAAIVNFLINC